MNLLNEVRIKYIIPSNSFNLMVANCDKSGYHCHYFIYSHRDQVIFHAYHESDDPFLFTDKVVKIASFKYFNEKTDNCLKNIANIDFDKKVAKKIKIGTCLVTPDLLTNFKADVWIDNLTHEVILSLYDAGEFTKDLCKPGMTLGEIELPDPYLESN